MTPAILENFLSPAVLFFLLGVAASVAGSGLKMPDAFSRAMTIFLLIAIGFKGGTALASEGLVGQAWILIIMGGALSFAMPLVGYIVLRRITQLQSADAAVVAAHFGSVSVVTFMAAVTFLQVHGLDYSGHMVVLMVIMEIPAVISGIWLARRFLPAGEDSASESTTNGLHLFSNQSVMLLLGSLAIGAAAQGGGREQLEAFLITPMYGVLCLFLLDMGVKAGLQLQSLRENGRGLLVFGFMMPLAGGAVALGAATLMGTSVADATLFAVLAASASYIVVPAAMQIAVPEANTEIGTSLSMGVTFPFNVVLGIPLYYALASALLTR